MLVTAEVPGVGEESEGGGLFFKLMVSFRALLKKNKFEH